MLNSCGGMESRILKYAEHLRKNGIEPYFLSTYNNSNPILKNFTCFFLRFYDANFQECLFKLLQHKHFNCVEFHLFGNSPYFEKIDMQTLKASCRAGATLHGSFRFPKEQLSKLDYCCLVTKFLDYDKPNRTVQPNGVNIQPPCWTYSGQRKALFVSRLDKEKLPTLRAFLDFCKKKHISPEVAGPLSQKPAAAIRTLIEQDYKKSVTFIGEIDTLSFLKDHPQDYLFVGGVGQVPLEALSLGYPAFVCSHFGMEYSSFVTEDNFESLRLYNFVIRNNKGMFPVSQELPNGSTPPLPNELLEKISFSSVVSEYRKIIQL